MVLAVVTNFILPRVAMERHGHRFCASWSSGQLTWSPREMTLETPMYGAKKFPNDDDSLLLCVEALPSPNPVRLKDDRKQRRLESACSAEQFH